MLEQHIANGIIISSIYALAALGLALIFSTLDVPDFAQGQMYMVGAFVTYFLVVKYNFGLIVSICMGMFIVGFLGMSYEWLTYRRVRHLGHLPTILGSFGLCVFFENMALILWGEQIRSIPTIYSTTVYHFWGITITQIRIIALVVVIILITALQLFLKKTRVGKAMRAVSQNSLGATLAGINLNRMYSVTFIIGSAIASAIGALLGMLYNVAPPMGFYPVLKAFVIVVMAGMGSVVGIIFASLLLGMAESLGGGYIASAYTDTFAFGILVIALIIKPKGLFGK
jgi:branched-chain amino acid transport system permease protein